MVRARGVADHSLEVNRLRWKPVLPLAPRVRLRIFFHGRTPRLIGERVGAQLKTNHLRQCVPASLEVEYCPGRCRGPDLAPLRAAVRVVDPTGRAVAAGTPEACPSGIRHVGGADGIRCASVSRKAEVRTGLPAGGSRIRTLGPPWGKYANMRSRAKIGKSRPRRRRRGEASSDPFINCRYNLEEELP